MIFPAKRINLNHITSNVVWNVEPYTAGSVQANSLSSAAWGTAVITLKRSNDGRTWYALSSPQTLGPGAAMSDTIDLDFAWLSAEVTTAEGADEYAELVLCAKAEFR